MPTKVWLAKTSVRSVCIAARTSARSSLTVVRRQVMGSRVVWVYSMPSDGWSVVGLVVVEGVAPGGSMEVIFLILESVRTRLFSDGFWADLLVLSAVVDVLFPVPGVADGKETRAPGSRLCVMKVRLVSTFASLTLISLHRLSTISSSFKKLTSRFVGWTLTSTRCGSMSRLR